MLVCHYCGYQQSLGNNCPSCLEGIPRPYGFGTEQIEIDLKTLFPQARIARIDRDEISNVTHLEKIIKLVENREIDILIGTQMMAKGLDFPSLKLVGFVNADIGLQMPDFRAQERGSQLLFQMAGRSGRHATQQEEIGKVVVQTYNPQNPIFLTVLEQDYVSFLNEELERRRELMYPPIGRMALFQIESKTINYCESAALKLRDLSLFASKSYREEFKVQVLGPIPAPIPKIRNHFRYQLILKSDKTVPVSKICKWVLLEFNKLKLRVTVHVDVDPYHLI
jgi:primosomal protein N' (replication factor Y)